MQYKCNLLKTAFAVRLMLGRWLKPAPGNLCSTHADRFFRFACRLFAAGRLNSVCICCMV